MSITYLTSRGNNSATHNVLNQPVGIQYLTSQKKYTNPIYDVTYSEKEDDDEREQNVGGLLGGLGFLGEKLAVGAVSSIEGIVDYLGSGFAKLFGRDDWAEDIIANDWFGDWYSHPEEWYNPDQTMKFVGDVAGGIGSSIPAMAATVGAAVATGGASLAVQGAAGFGASFLTSGLGAAGRSTKEAYEQSGELTDKEFAYGALSGATEGGLEGVTNLLGMGTGAIVKGITKSLAKETSEALLKNVAVEGLKSFAGEAFEEGVSEWLTPYWKRATYDPNAKDASLDEIMYSAVVGGVSGLVMDGGRFAFDKGASYTSGVKAAKKGSELQILEQAGDIARFEDDNQTGEELFSEIIKRRNKLSESLKATDGKAVRADQQMELGALKRAVVAASNEIGVAKRAMNIVNNAETIAERLTSYGYKKADGTQITYTADQLTAGYDKTSPQSIFKALKTNDDLRSLAIADFTGHLMMDTNKFKQATLTGEMLASQVDLNRFLQQANPEEVAAVSNALKIDSWSGLTAEMFNQKIIDFLTDGGVQSTLKANELKKIFKAIPAEQAQGVPKLVNLLSDGTRRYTDGKLDIGVELKGDKYTIYDYNNDTLSRGMSKDEINSVFRDYSKRNAEGRMQNAELTEGTIPQSAEPTAPFTQESREYNKLVEDIKKFQSETREVESFAREHVKEYAKLSKPTKDMINNVIREGRKNGLSDEDVTMLARVSAHSGIDIQFDKEATYRGTKEDGTADYADGFYEASKNRIVINPEGKRTAEKLLIHELDHAIRKYVDKTGKQSTRIYFDAIEGVDQATRDKILGAYKKTAKPGEVAAVVMDETNAYYAEQVLGNKYTLEKLLEAEPTLKDKILSFFKGASTDYADVPKLSNAAKKYYKTYKKLFDEFSARNVESNSMENAHLGTLFAENSQKTPLTNMKQENMQVSGRQYSIVEPFTDDNGKTFENAVLLDTTFFNGLSPRNWGSKLKGYVENRSQNDPFILQIADENGQLQDLVFARKSDRVKKDGGSEHSALTELYKTTDNLSKLSAIHIDEIIEVSEENNPYYSSENSHGSFDKNGWLHRNANVINAQNGKIYNVTVDIAKTEDGRTVLYATKGKIKKVGQAKVNSLKIRGSTPHSNFKGIISQNNSKINTSTKKSSKQHALDLGDNKKAQFDIIQSTNPMWDEYHVGIRSANDIRTWDEVLKLDDEREGQFVWGDFSRADAEQALKNGKVTVYSSYPINNGVFVSTSYVQAEEYAGGRGGKVYSKTVPLDKVAWINGDEGQYADVTASSGKQYALDIDSDDGNISGATVMSWLNKKPESDGKLDLEATVARGLPYKRGKSDLTVGELRKVIANTTHEKVYSKSDALKAVNKLSGTWGLTVKARDEIADTVWQFLNEAPDIEYRQDMAHDIAEYIVAKLLMDSKTENPDALEAAERLSYLRTGIGKLSFSDEDIA